ncbi:unnamed protein product [Cladocopium goreaui]|uniref:Uncharacterized protein n=1 Tax=Cladocopium goreaui TaxID=2562237 RepID=A0A9P1FFA5_9DINO|nr:unnamed protein product [Cladocopium goreaui]
MELGSISIKLSEFRVLCLRAIEQIVLCFGVVFLVIFSFAFAINGMTREVEAVTSEEWSDIGATSSTLIRLAFGAMDMVAVQSVAYESPLLIVATLLNLSKELVK